MADVGVHSYIGIKASLTLLSELPYSVGLLRIIFFLTYKDDIACFFYIGSVHAFLRLLQN